MSQTTNLQLNKHDNPSTNENQFDIENYLNVNWDKIDTKSGQIDTSIQLANSTIAELQEEIEKLKNASYKVSGTGTDVTLNNTSNNKFLKLDVKGNTEQDNYTGRNKLPTQKDLWESGYYDTSGQKADFSGRMRLINLLPVNSSTTYSVLGSTFYVREFDAQGNFINNAGTVSSNGTFTTNSNTAYLGLSVAITYSDYVEVTNQIAMFLNSETDKTWEKFVGGIPSPNPTFPQSIKNVTGDANVKIQNKNWLPFKNQDFTINGMNFKVVNGEFIINGTATAEISSRSSGFIENFSFILSPGTYYFKKSSGINGYIREYEGNNTIIQQNQGSFTITKEVKAYYGIYMANATSKSNAINTDQVELGSSFSSYVIHQEQNLPLTLGTQRLYEGSYLADDGIHHIRKQVVFDGSEDETWDIRSDTHEMRINLGSNAIYNSLLLANQFKQVNSYSTTGNNIRWVANSTLICISSETLDTANMTLEQWKTYLQSHNLIIEFGISEETEAYTTTQQTQYNAIKEAMSYYEQTNISSTSNEASAKIDATAIGDLNLVIS